VIDRFINSKAVKRFATIDDAQEVAAAIPSGLVRFEGFPNAGHGVYRDQPEGFFKILREFILS